MANSIDGVGGGTPLNPAQQQVQATEAREHERPAEERRESEALSDRVTLTPQAQRLKELEGQVSRLPVVDQTKVERIRNEIAQGTYQMDPQRVAEKMLQFEAQVFGADKDDRS